MATITTTSSSSTTRPLSLLAFLQAYPEILLSLSCFLLIFYYSHRQNIAPVNWPVTGMFPTVISHFHHIHDHIVDILRETRWTFRLTGPWYLNMTTSSPVIHPLSTISSPSTSQIIQKEKTSVKHLTCLIGKGIFNSNGDSWRIQRKAAHIIIRDRAFRSFVVNATKNKAKKGLIPA